MFSSKNKDKESGSAAQASVQAPAPQPAKRAARASAPSIISSDLVVNGTLTSTGDIQIDGRVEGDVHSSGLVIGEKALIHGEVLAEDVTVRGRVQGSIRARKVLLCATCHVEGNILHEAFAVEAGAFFEGNCRHSDNPLAEDPNRRTTEFKPTVAGAAPTPVSVLAPAPTQNTVAPRADAMVPPPKPAAAANFAPLKT
jgi:cytoskeletal protein CcmA (bactofilin family)